MKIFGHRGLNQPENPKIPFQNTIEALNLSLENNIDGIEIDVQVSKDSEIFVIHDDDISIRSKFSKGKISELNSDEIENKRVGEHDSFKIPKLTEIIDIFKNNEKTLNIEIKQKNAHEIILKEVKKSKITKDKIIISSFNLEDIVSLRQLDKNINLGIIFANKQRYEEEYLINLQSKTSASYIIEKSCDYPKIFEQKIDKYFWTFKKNDLSDFDRVKQYNNSNIITDYPEIYLDYENR